jgi:dolichol-phosphate mannosyltransferase
MKLSVVMPAQNEEGSVGATVEGVVAALGREEIDYEVIVVDDGSEDSTAATVEAIGTENPRVRCHRSHYERGFGMAIRAGLDVFEGDAVAIVMADASDDPDDSSATTGYSKTAGTAPSARASCWARRSTTTRA